MEEVANSQNDGWKQKGMVWSVFWVLQRVQSYDHLFRPGPWTCFEHWIKGSCKKTKYNFAPEDTPGWPWLEHVCYAFALSYGWPEIEVVFHQKSCLLPLEKKFWWHITNPASWWHCTNLSRLRTCSWCVMVTYPYFRGVAIIMWYELIFDFVVSLKLYLCV